MGRVSRIALAAAWLTAVVGGFAALAKYKLTPSESGTIVSRWPSGARVQPAADRAELIVFAHPQCPCTRATISELNRLMSRYGKQLDAWVLFSRPEGTPESFTRSDLWTSASRIPGVRVGIDENNAEAVRFGVATSGTVVVYRDGRLLFHGGITPERGHEGDSLGRERLISLVTTGTADRDEAPVFGCALASESDSKGTDR